jgi:hypothetical protein
VVTVLLIPSAHTLQNGALKGRKFVQDLRSNTAVWVADQITSICPIENNGKQISTQAGSELNLF